MAGSGNPPLTLEAANLFCGTAQQIPADSNHLVITDLKLPAHDEAYTDHMGGGASIAIEINRVINKLETTFVLVGFNPQVMSLANSWSNMNNTFTAYGVVRNQITGQAAQAAAQFNGRLAHVDPQVWNRGGVLHTNYAIKGITTYELNIGGQQLYFWDFGTNTLLINGIDMNKDVNTFLVTGASPAVSGLTNVQGFTASN